ncbi:MAG TPA: transposase [Gallionellaceae bacterium]|nr:transposase [Gallionellaceae bacterium]
MFYLGMDVAKAKLDCCLLLDETGAKRKTKVVQNSKSGVADLLAWVGKQHVSAGDLHVIMEGTGVYHEQAALALADAGVTVSIVNPAQIKDFGKGLAVRTKTDGVDSFVLARYGALLKPAAWKPPAPEVRMLQALLARRDAIAQDLRREQNRQEKADATDTPELIRQSLADSERRMGGA